MKAKLFGTVLVLAGLAICTAAAADDPRAQIAAERRVIEERFVAEQAACMERFAVTDCVDESRARHRADLAPLRERELKLDDAVRRARAQLRLDAVAAKRAAAASQAAASQAAAAAPSAARPGKLPASAAGHADRGDKSRDNTAAQAAQAAEAADRARAAERRREAARLTQERIARRLAEKAAQGKKAEPLPAPGAASAAR